MAAFKYFVNKINIKHRVQCYLIRNQEEGGIGANMVSYSPRKLHKGVCTMATLSQKQTKVNNMKIRDTEMIMYPSYAPVMQPSKL